MQGKRDRSGSPDTPPRRDVAEIYGSTWGPLRGEGAVLAFADELGRPIHPQRLTEWFSKLRKAAGIRTGSLHVLRHTANTLMLTNGIPVHVVAARVGDTATTILSTYAHLLPQSDEIAAERVAAALSA
jgi:integrase